MAPKYRGDSEDWLDQEGSKGPGRRTKREPKAKPLPLEKANATVAEVFPNQARVRTDTGTDLVCNYRRSTVIGAASEGRWRERSPVAVGDRVLVEKIGTQEGVISGVARRTSQLMRPAPGREELVHALAANVHSICIVSSAGHPAFSPGLVDRFLVAASFGGIEPVVIINKIDLLESESRPWEMYRELGFQVREVSAKSGLGIEALRQSLSSSKAVFCGQSGVGKTSLLTALLGKDIGRVGEVSEATGKGRHTTTGAVLLDDNWIDTPGVREFGLVGVEPEQLKEHYPEFASLQCQSTGCFHMGEPECAAQAESLPRLQSYRRIFESLQAGEH